MGHPLPGPVHAGAEYRLAAVHEAVGPALAQETGVVGAEYAVEDLPAHVVGEHPVVVRRRPRGVREMRDPHVRAQVGEHARDQGQVVVLDRRPGRNRPLAPRVLGQRLGEGLVIGAVGLPLPGEGQPEVRPVRRVEQHVVHEPQRGVRDGVVSAVEDRRGDVEHAHAPAAWRPVQAHAAVRGGPRRGPVGVAERRADPQRVALLGDRGEPGHHPAAAAPGRQPPAVVERERHRPPVGRDEHQPVP